MQFGNGNLGSDDMAHTWAYVNYQNKLGNGTFKRFSSLWVKEWQFEPWLHHH
jgi:hypothetical protein